MHEEVSRGGSVRDDRGRVRENNVFERDIAGSIGTAANRRSKRAARAHQSAVVRRIRGTRPGTKGEELTVRYLVDQFKMLGVKPGGSDGTYIQKVPLVGITPSPAPL